jgi:transcription elongation factor Elf1
MTTDADKLKNKAPCPFCGCDDLRIARLSDASDVNYQGEYEAIACNNCDATAPIYIWNARSGAGAPLPLGIQEALNSGDGVYRP